MNSFWFVRETSFGSLLEIPTDKTLKFDLQFNYYRGNRSKILHGHLAG